MNNKLHRIYVGSFFLIGTLSLLLLIFNGIDYYSLSIEDRFFSTKHLTLKPSGAVGHGLGIIGTLMMIAGVLTYMLRKRVRKFFNLGLLKHWLEFHIFLCTVGPVLVLFHTAFKFGGIVAVSFWSMVAVVLSGVVGRFIYIQIPHSIQGNEIDITELNELDFELTNKLKNIYKINPLLMSKIETISNIDKYKTVSFRKSLVIIKNIFFENRKIITELKDDVNFISIKEKNIKQEIISTLKSKLILTRRIGMLRTMQTLFKYWHIAHLPFAIAMFVIMIIHVGITILFGYKWIF